MNIKQKCEQFRKISKKLSAKHDDIELILRITPNNFEKLQMTSNFLDISRNDVINLLVEEFLI